MGVTGLWRLIEPAGKPVPVENLENKVLAVDISIWLHQMVKGYQDAKGAPLPNAHLMGLFQRLCKLLYFRIKPVFVFDGGFPDLKRETIAKRQYHKAKYNSESERLKRELALLLSKKTAISSLLGKNVSPKKAASVADNDDLFKLPELPQREEETESDESEDEQNSSGSIVDLHSVDIESENFKSMPVKEKYDLLIELKETRKMNSWGKIHELPKKSDNFSDFQMQRLLKRRKVQEQLEETEKEMGGTSMSLNELETLLNEEGIDTKLENIPTKRIASNNTTRFLLINDVKQALAEAKKKKELENNSGPSQVSETSDDTKTLPDIEEEDDLQKAIKMSLECVDDHEDNANKAKTDDSWASLMSDSDKCTDSEEEDGFQHPEMTSAKGYIMQYSDFTYKAIDEIVGSTRHKRKKSKTNVEEIINQINNENSIIVDKVDISSNDISSSDVEICEQRQDITLSSENENDLMEAAKDSIICFGNVESEVITLDTSVETQSEKESDSNDDEDFEEVRDVKQPVVQLTLNINDIPHDNSDDIFADVFISKKSTPDKKATVISSTKTKENSGIEVPVICQDTSINLENNMLSSNDVLKLNQEFKETNDSVIKDDHSSEAVNDVEANKPQNITFQNTILNKEEKNINTQNTQLAKEDSNKTLKQVMSQKELTNIEEAIEEQQRDLLHEKGRLDRIGRKITEETQKELNNMEEAIEEQQRDLLQEKGRLDRIGRNITEEMTKDAQELLQIFGIPYVIAPMEAEAQCAFLESAKLTDGTITDDSDIWLFGGRTVYKNFFNQKKHVMQFLGDRIERSFNLTREQLILLALLVGSDYTTGVNGVGPVTALEILASFPFNKSKLNDTEHHYSQLVAGLKTFKQWIKGNRSTDNISLRRKLKNVIISDDFPSVRVVQAYLEPKIEKSEEKFTWGNLDLTILRDYTKAKFGWSQSKLDEIIKPILKRMLERKNQKTVEDYFKRKIDFHSLEDHMSKRVKAAVQKMGPETSDEMSANTENHTSNTRKQKLKESGSSKTKECKKNEKPFKEVVKILSITDKEGKADLEISIPKTDRVQEIIPQREKDKKHILENKMKAIEIFRKTKIDRKRKPVKRKPILPKQKAELSESSDSD